MIDCQSTYKKNERERRGKNSRDFYALDLPHQSPRTIAREREKKKASWLSICHRRLSLTSYVYVCIHALKVIPTSLPYSSANQACRQDHNNSLNILLSSLKMTYAHITSSSLPLPEIISHLSIDLSIEESSSDKLNGPRKKKERKQRRHIDGLFLLLLWRFIHRTIILRQYSHMISQIFIMIFRQILETISSMSKLDFVEIVKSEMKRNSLRLSIWWIYLANGWSYSISWVINRSLQGRPRLSISTVSFFNRIRNFCVKRINQSKFDESSSFIYLQLLFLSFD